MEQPVHERGRVLFESPLNSTEPGLVVLPNGARGIHEPDGEADRQKHERGDDGQPHVYFHDSLDNEINEKVRGPSRSLFISVAVGPAHGIEAVGLKEIGTSHILWKPGQRSRIREYWPKRQSISSK